MGLLCARRSIRRPNQYVCCRSELETIIGIYDTDRTQDKKAIARNIEAEARGATVLFIWTDCDREGEHIGTEIRDIAWKVNPRLEVFRARFSNIERA